MMRTKHLLGMASTLGLALAGLTMAPAASAQTAPAAAPDAKDKPADTGGKDEIVVTAERKTQNLQNYAGTATILTGATLKETGIRNITDLEGHIPGLQILANNNNIEVYIRGVGSSNNTELGDPAAGTYYDGIYIPRPAGFGSIFFDIDRVEVAIGPQGTLRGRNATAGTVNIIPWHPGLNTYDAYVEGGIGNYGLNTEEAMLNVPIGDKIAIRVGGEHLYNGSYTHNVGPVTGVRGPEWNNNFAGRAQLLFKPSDKFDMLLSFDNTVENGGGTIGTNLSGAEANGIDISHLNLRDVYLYPTDPHQHTVHSGEKAEFNYHGPDMDIQLAISHRSLYADFIGSPPGQLAYPGGLNNVNNGTANSPGDPAGDITQDWAHYETQGKSISDTQELRLTAPKGAKFEWTLGAFHFNENQATFLGSVASQNPFFQGIEFNTRTNSRSLAAYTDDTFHVNDRFSVTGGLRYTDDTKERTGAVARYLMALGDGHYNCCMGPIVGSPGFQFAGLGRTDFTLPDPTQSAAVQAQQALNYYFGGVKSFGIYDTVPGIFPGGLLPPGPSGQCVPNPGSGLYCAAPGYNYGPPGSNGKYLYATIDSTEFFNENAQDHYHFIDWRVRGQFDIDSEHMVYGLVATGNKAGGFNDNLGTGNLAPTYRPERVTNFEIGSKNRFTIAGQPARFNISAFVEDYHDQVLSSLVSLATEASEFALSSGVTVPTVPGFSPGAIVVNYNYNAANSRIAGTQFNGGITIPAARLSISFDALWLPEAKVTASQTIEDFRFQSDLATPGYGTNIDAGNRSIQGKRLPRTPRLQLNAQIGQKFKTGIGSFDYVIAPGYRSSTYATIFNGQDYAYDACKSGGTVTDINGTAYSGCAVTTTYRGRLNDTLKGYATLDIGAGFSNTNGRIRIEAFVNNILYKNQVNGILISQTGGTVAFLPRPTTYGARLHVRF